MFWKNSAVLHLQLNSLHKQPQVKNVGSASGKKRSADEANQLGSSQKKLNSTSKSPVKPKGNIYSKLNYFIELFVYTTKKSCINFINQLTEKQQTMLNIVKKLLIFW